MYKQVRLIASSLIRKIRLLQWFSTFSGLCTLYLKTRRHVPLIRESLVTLPDLVTMRVATMRDRQSVSKVQGVTKVLSGMNDY